MAQVAQAPQALDGIGGPVGTVPVPAAMGAPPGAARAAVALGRVAATERGPLARLVIHAVLLCGAVVAATPFYWMIVTAFKDNREAISFPPTFIPTEWHPENFALALASAPFGQY